MIGFVSSVAKHGVGVPLSLLVLLISILQPCASFVPVRYHHHNQLVQQKNEQQQQHAFVVDRSSSNNLPNNNDFVSKSRTILYMGWGPEPVWSTGKIVSGPTPACESGKTVILQMEVPAETAKSYSTPGQYVQVQPANAAEKPLFLAIASAPSNDTNIFEFLIKKNENNEWITSASSLELQVSQVLGNGYAITENIDSFKYDFPVQNIILCAAGSGLAPIVAAIRYANYTALTKNGSRTCRLYYGEQTPSDLCYIDQYTTWEQMGIQVVPVLSQSSSDSDSTAEEDDTWYGRVGYIQNAMEEDGIAIPRNTAALMCGMKGMTESVKDLLQKAGVFEGRIMLNF